MPEIWGVRLVGSLPLRVSAEDVVLEMLRRHGVAGGVGRIIESYGSGLDAFSAMDRHVIADMGAELGATGTVFPADHAVRDFNLITADLGARYDVDEQIDLSTLEPLIARPGSPGNVVPVREVAGPQPPRPLRPTTMRSGSTPRRPPRPPR
jgi:aconitate hydratase